MTQKRIHFQANTSPVAQSALQAMVARYGQCSRDTADVVIALGGDGFMLQTLHELGPNAQPVYGMNCGTIGFMMNAYGDDDLEERLSRAEETIITPLEMHATTPGGDQITAQAINEVSLLRAGPQAAKLAIYVDGRLRLNELTCDGALLCTPAGSTAYNYSAHGPVLPINSHVLALTAIAPFRPRRWRGALLPQNVTTKFEVLEPEKRPVMADADSRSVPRVTSVSIRSRPDLQHRLLFDPGHGLEERLNAEQFS